MPPNRAAASAAPARMRARPDVYTRRPALAAMAKGNSIPAVSLTAVAAMIIAPPVPSRWRRST